MKYTLSAVFVLILAGCSVLPFNTNPAQPFVFVQLCDPQLGMGGYEHDVNSFEQAAAQINALKPDFAVICGDLVNTPDEQSFSDFNRIKASLNVPVYCAPGNHDVGGKPDASSLKLYREKIGEDWFSFRHKGFIFVVVNTQLWKSPTEGESEKQDLWLEETLGAARREGRPVIVVGHSPLFLKEPDEPEEYFNIPLEKRKKLLSLLKENGVVVVLTGHTHKTLVNDYQGIQMVSGETTSVNFDKRPMGFRLWNVLSPTSVSHEFVPLTNLQEEASRMKSIPDLGMSMGVSEVPSGFPVGFCLLTHNERQYVAFYDYNRRMTVACRSLDSCIWECHVLPETVGWDSHNYITMALDEEGYIHLSGNMHGAPLVYFRSSNPWDVRSLARIGKMIGENEKRCTYPAFMRGAKGELIFHYRDGGSGNGNEIYNVYDMKTKTWRRLLDSPLSDGRGKMNAYFDGPNLGPDGFFHLCWVWRDTGDCSTNHDLSYARSRDLVHWETIDGSPVILPMTLETKGLIVDPVPVKGGIINGSCHVGFDSRKRPLVSYHKFDKNGKTQVYIARYENSSWVSYQVSDWDYSWDFKGGGSIIFEIVLGSVRSISDGKLALPFSHVKYGSGELLADEETLKPVGSIKPQPRYPDSLNKPESDFPDMQVRWAEDLGSSGEPGIRYVLRWETLPHNRDQSRTGPLPMPGALKLYKLKAGR